MIYVPRPPVPLLSEQRRRIEEKKARLIDEIKTLGKQRRAQDDRTVVLLFMPALKDVFQGKCAYCESPVGAASHATIDQFFPKSRHPDRAYDWENLYLACTVCNVNKGGVDPAEESTGEIWLLDPCTDHPNEYLEFTPEGHILPKADAPQKSQSRAERSIAALGLNRLELVEQRRRVIEDVQYTIDAIDQSSGSISTASLEARLGLLTSSASPYSAAASAACERRSMQAGKGHLVSAASRPQTHGKELRPTYIQRIEIKGFRFARDVSMDVPVGWLALLGENGTAKTTILQAIALALMGDKGRSLWPSNPLTKSAKDSPETGSIRVHLSTEAKPIEIQFGRSDISFRSGEEGARTVVRAYGAVRLIGSSAPRAPTEAQWVNNLFDARVELEDVHQWAASLSEEELDAFGLATKDLLRLDDNAVVEMGDSGRLQIRAGESVSSYDELSVGYQSMISLLADLTAAARLTGFADPADAFGIVLLDELGIHLHPHWRMTIVDALRRTFRHMQFIVTTHEPLCLRGLRQGEVALLERHGADLRVDVELPDPSTMRVDQLLTSRFFGLHSTIDPSLDRQFRRYYELLAAHSRTPEEEDELITLKETVKRCTVLGNSRRDQMVYEAIDEYLSAEPALWAEERKTLKRETIEKVRELWKTASSLVGKNL